MLDDDPSTTGRKESVPSDLPSSIVETVGRHGLDPFLDAPASLHEALESPLRKQVLEELIEADGELPVRDLAARIAGSEVDSPADDPSEVHMKLHHVHLPKLQSCGLVNIDEDTGNTTSTLNSIIE